MNAKTTERCPNAPEPFNYCPDCDQTTDCPLRQNRVDMTDDWMNPPPTKQPSISMPEYPRFIIKRCRKIDYPPFTRWDNWQIFETKYERDAALKQLQIAHPVWQLRAVDELHAPLSYN